MKFEELATFAIATRRFPWDALEWGCPNVHTVSRDFYPCLNVPEQTIQISMLVLLAKQVHTTDNYHFFQLNLHSSTT